MSFTRMLPRAGALPLAFLAAALVAAPLTARSADLQVSPVRVLFPADQRAQSLQIANSGSQPLEAQVRIQRWTQQGGADQLTPAEDIVVSPAILRVAPGQSQTVRLVRVDGGPPARELSYRVLVDELPNKSAASANKGLKVLMRYSIPVFIDPAPSGPRTTAAAKPPAAIPLTNLEAVRAQLVPGAAGGTELRVRNDGARHLRISHLSANAKGDAARSLGDGLIGYVLPGQQMSWPVDLRQPTPPDLILKARFNDDRQAQVLPLDGAGR